MLGDYSAEPSALFAQLMKLASKLLEIAQNSQCENAAEARRVLNEASEGQTSMIRALYDAQLVDENQFSQGLAEWLKLPVWDQFIESLSAEVRERVPAKIALKHHLLPAAFDEEQQVLDLITYDPFDLVSRQVISSHLDCRIRWHLATRVLVLEGLRQGYGVGAETFDLLLEGRDPEDLSQEMEQETTSLDLDDDEASVIKFVNQIFREALELRATDIHVEPLEDDLRIRYRIDGVLHEVPVPDKIKLLQSSVIARLKIMAHLDIAERRLPQDGRIPLELAGQSIDVRVAVIPSVNGESVSLRLLGREQFNLDKLDLEKEALEDIKELLDTPNGIVLVTGPTGSGKSTTLYSLLSVLNTEERRIVTIEDPVEYKLPGVVQIAVKPEIDLTFARGLRSILRGDPNVIMIGEMRDFETAEIAIRGALTGHLVFSTLHTNDSVGGITRLLDMGVEPFLVASSVRAFLAQRLVRTLCQDCKKPGHYPESYLKSIGFPMHEAGKIHTAVGCPKCRGSGYAGRAAIYEVCMINERMAELISDRANPTLLKKAAQEEGLIPLRRYGFRKIIQGRTTLEEVLRVTAVDQKEDEPQEVAIA
jgi:general secretion pathway protein E/type IV pilus assembly protein PilB